MKLSETNGEMRKEYLEYVQTRWTQLQETLTERAETVWKYLLLTNSGSAIAALSFMGANKTLTPIPNAPSMLIAFLVGVVLVGVGHAIGYYRANWLFAGWENDVSNYFADKTTWSDPPVPI